MIQRARIFLYRSRLSSRFQDRQSAVLPASRAIALLLPQQRRAPGDTSLALLTAAALHHARSLTVPTERGWDPKHRRHLERLLRALGEKTDELSPEQQQELARYRRK